MTSQNYLHVPVDQLTFVRVLHGIEGFEVNKDGSLKVASPNFDPNSPRNTTHGTLNAIVSDVIGGKFSESTFAVVGNLLDMAKNNELISLSPADTYFWNQDRSISVPNAVLFAPDDAQLPKEIHDRIKVISYPAAATDRENFVNMHLAVQQYFESQQLPFHRVDGRAWIDLPYDRAGIDHGTGRDNVANAIGYHIDSGLHDGTPYESLEMVAHGLRRLIDEMAGINTVEQYMSANAERARNNMPNLIESMERLNEQYQDSVGELPRHQKEFYCNLLDDRFKNVAADFNLKLDVWFPDPAQLSNLSQAQAAPPPIPSLDPDGQVLVPTPPAPPPIFISPVVEVEDMRANPTLAAYVAALYSNKTEHEVGRSAQMLASLTEQDYQNSWYAYNALQFSLLERGLEANLTTDQLVKKFDQDPAYSQCLENPIVYQQYAALNYSQERYEKDIHEYMCQIREDIKDLNPDLGPDELRDVQAFQKKITTTLNKYHSFNDYHPEAAEVYRDINRKLQTAIEPTHQKDAPEAVRCSP